MKKDVYSKYDSVEEAQAAIDSGEYKMVCEVVEVRRAKSFLHCLFGGEKVIVDLRVIDKYFHLKNGSSYMEITTNMGQYWDLKDSINFQISVTMIQSDNGLWSPKNI